MGMAVIELVLGRLGTKELLAQCLVHVVVLLARVALLSYPKSAIIGPVPGTAFTAGKKILPLNMHF
jgi:hypothetical protein